MTSGIRVLAREAELLRLRAALSESLDGKAQLVLLAGDAGAGKTVLMHEFARRAEADNTDLVVAEGICDPQTGPGDPFLPFREILVELSGAGAEEKPRNQTTARAGRLQQMAITAGETLVDFAPDLIGIFVPGASLLAKAGKIAANKSGWSAKLRKRLEQEAPSSNLDASKVFEQYVNALTHISERAPLLLLVDDLQWADTASLALLFRLSRRLEGSRVMILGSYRPSDISFGREGDRHPLETTLSEIKRILGDVTIDLDEAARERGAEFVAELLGSQDNLLGEDFAAGLLNHAGGSPLFTVELMRSLQESGMLEQAEGGAWQMSAKFDWNALPSRVEGVLEERTGRLEEEAARSLTIASVEGERFAAEVISKVQPIDLRVLVRDLSESSQKRHRLILVDGVSRVGQVRFSHYRFANKLLQAYLYSRLDEVQAAFLHEDVANALEDLYGDQADEAAVQLARHFDLAGVPDKARRYSLVAGRMALRAYALEAAITHLTRALELTAANDATERFEVLVLRAPAYRDLGRATEHVADLDEVTRLAGELGEPGPKAHAAYLRCVYFNRKSRFEEVVPLASGALQWARAAGDVETEVHLLMTLGTALSRSSRLEEAASTLETALERARASGLKSLEAQALVSLAEPYDLLGERDKVLSALETSVTMSRAIGDLGVEQKALGNRAIEHWRRANIEAAEKDLRANLEVSRRIGDLEKTSRALGNLGIVLQSRHDYPASLAALEESLSISRYLEIPYNVARVLGVIGNAKLVLGDVTGALDAHLEAFKIDEAVNDRQDLCYRAVALANVNHLLGLDFEATSYLERARELTSGATDSYVKCYLGTVEARLARSKGDYDTAAALALEGVATFKEVKMTLDQLQETVLLAGILCDKGDLEGAQRALAEAQTLRPTEVSPDLQCCLGRLALLKGDPAGALVYVAQLVEEAGGSEFYSATDRLEALGTIYEILRANSDPRASNVLQNGRRIVADCARCVPDEARRHRLVENLTGLTDFWPTA